MSDRVALVTGANHGIGADTARQLAARGDRVLISFLRVHDAPAAGTPAAYRHNGAQDADLVVPEIRAAGGQVEAVEADLRDPATASRLFDAAEAAFGPVEILGQQRHRLDAGHVQAGRERSPRASAAAADGGEREPGAGGRRPWIGAADRGVCAPARCPRGDLGAHRRLDLWRSASAFRRKCRTGRAKRRSPATTCRLPSELAGYGITSNVRSIHR